MDVDIAALQPPYVVGDGPGDEFIYAFPSEQSSASRTASDVWVMFKELVAVGFSEHQAIELLSGWVCIDGRGVSTGGSTDRSAMEEELRDARAEIADLRAQGIEQ